MSCPLDELTPPPAYSEGDFDRKTSIALELSLTAPQSHNSAWHDDDFEAAAHALASKPYVQGAAGPVFQPVNPLKINKKADQNAPSKPLPNWLHHLQTTVDGRISDPPDSAGRRPVAVTYSTHQLPTDADDLRRRPPPAFTSRGPSLNGPPYEQIASSPWAESRVLPTPQVQQSRGDVYYRKPRHSLPQLPRTHHQTTPQRPVSQYSSHMSTATPISTFDPSLAYHQDPNFGIPQQSARDYEARNDIHGTTSLYKSVVIISHMLSYANIYGQCRSREPSESISETSAEKSCWVSRFHFLFISESDILISSVKANRQGRVLLTTCLLFDKIL